MARRRLLHQRLTALPTAGRAWGLLSLAELHLVRRGLAPLIVPPCQCHPKAFCGGEAFGQMRAVWGCCEGAAHSRVGAGPPAHLNTPALTFLKVEQGFIPGLVPAWLLKALGAAQS